MEAQFEGEENFDTKPLAKPPFCGVECRHFALRVCQLDSLLSYCKYLISKSFTVKVFLDIRRRTFIKLVACLTIQYIQLEVDAIAQFPMVLL